MTIMPPTEDLACVGKVYIRRTGETGVARWSPGTGPKPAIFGVWQMPQRESEKRGKIRLQAQDVLSGELKGDRHDPLQVT